MNNKLITLCPALVFTLTTHASLVGLWEFSDANDPTLSTVGSNLILNNTNNSIAPAAGMNGSDGAYTVGLGDSFSLNHGIAPNGGSSTYVNQYTLLWDLYLPPQTENAWRSLLQTATLPTSNDGDYFISPNDNIGVGAIGYSSNTLPASTWHRIVFSAAVGGNIAGQAASSFMTTVTDMDGNSWQHFHTTQALDGRHSLFSTANSNIVHFFADNDGDDAAVIVSTIALYDVAATPIEALALGRPGDAVPSALVPEPHSLGLIFSGCLILMMWRKRERAAKGIT